MNLLLSRRGDYVVRSALCLGRAYVVGEQRKIREVVAEMGVPQNYASQILSDLVKAGIATSKSGRDGGYMLARDPRSISLLEVVEAGEGPLAPQRCTLGDGPCRWDNVCPLHEAWSAAATALRDQLARTSLAELTDRDRATEEGLNWLPTPSHRKVRTSVKVEDWVHVERKTAAVGKRLQDNGSMSELIGEAYQEAESLRGHINPTGERWTGTTAVAVHVGTPVPQPDGTTRLPLAWDVSLLGGGDSRLDGEIELRPLDAHRTEVHLTGRFRPPRHAEAEKAPDELADRLTRATVRAFLRELTRTLTADDRSPETASVHR